MQKLKLLLGSLVALFIVSCEGPAGPPGPPGFDGLDGLDGINILGQVFEIETNFDFVPENNIWSTFPIGFSDFNVEVFESDAILIYRFDGSVELDDGSFADAWSQIPQNFFVQEGTLQYVFSNTFVDFEIFIDGNFDMSLLSTDFTDSQIFRIVVVPAEFTSEANFDPTNLNSVMEILNLNETDIKK